MRLIWLTRGRVWGHRFLLDGGLSDPLPFHSTAFAGLDSQHEAWRHIDGSVAVRIPDPGGRTDIAGRVISHEFVVIGPDPMADHIDSVESGRQQIWPLVSDEFERIWMQDEPPRTRSDLHSTP